MSQKQNEESWCYKFAYGFKLSGINRNIIEPQPLRTVERGSPSLPVSIRRFSSSNCNVPLIETQLGAQNWYDPSSKISLMLCWLVCGYRSWRIKTNLYFFESRQQRNRVTLWCNHNYRVVAEAMINLQTRATSIDTVVCSFQCVH